MRNDSVKACVWPDCGTLLLLTWPLCTKHFELAADIHLRDGGTIPDRTPRRDRTPVAPIDGTVYYVQVGGHIKIGWTSDLERRMKSYAPNSHLLAIHPGTRADEAKMHKRFATARTHGREWYAPVPSLLHHIEQMKTANGLPEVTFGAAPVTIAEPRPRRMLKTRGRVRQIAG